MKHIKTLIKEAMAPTEVHHIHVVYAQKSDLYRITITSGDFIIESVQITLQYDTIKSHYHITSIEGKISTYDIRAIDKALASKEQ